MGLYSQEAAEYIKGSAAPEIAPYSNSIMEFGLYNIRMDHAIFESLIEADFGQYLSEADGEVVTKKERELRDMEAQEKIDAKREEQKEERQAERKEKFDEAKAQVKNRASYVANKVSNIDWKQVWEKIKDLFVKAYEAISAALKNVSAKIQEFVQRGSAKKLQTAYEKYQPRFNIYKGADIELVSPKLALSELDKAYQEISKMIGTKVADALDDDVDNMLETCDKVQELINHARNSINVKFSAEEFAKNVTKEDVSPQAAIADSIKGIVSTSFGAPIKKAQEVADSFKAEIAAAEKAASSNTSADGGADAQKRYKLATKRAKVASALAQAYSNCVTAQIASANSAMSKIAAYFSGYDKAVDKEGKKQAKEATKAARKAGVDNSSDHFDINEESAVVSEEAVEEEPTYTFEELATSISALMGSLADIQMEECFEF